MKCIFIDMDNTIAENKTCDDIDFTPGLYINKRPIKIVIEAIKYLYPKYKYIIVSQNADGETGRNEKIDWLHKHFPEMYGALILERNKNKAEVIEQFSRFHNINLTKSILIDDKKSILQECKKIGLQVKYPQQVICDYEEKKGV